MSSIRLLFFISAFLIVGSGCSESVDYDEKKSSNEEQRPEIDTSKFREFKGDCFRIQLLKDMTLNKVSGTQLLEADYLPEEYHLKVFTTPISSYDHEESFPKDLDKQLEWFAKSESDRLKAKLLDSEKESLTETMVRNHQCFKQVIRGKSFGFPLQKTFFLRYYKTDNSLISIIAWTATKNENSFKSLQQYMGMSFSQD